VSSLDGERRLQEVNAAYDVLGREHEDRSPARRLEADSRAATRRWLKNAFAPAQLATKRGIRQLGPAALPLAGAEFDAARDEGVDLVRVSPLRHAVMSRDVVDAAFLRG
jgi:hypothetical protein